MEVRTARVLAVFCALAAVMLGAGASQAADRQLEFIHRLQQKGYADVALDYLDALESRADAPPKIREILDLERCNSYLCWAKASLDTKVIEQRLAQAQLYRKKFEKEHPGHPRTATAMAIWGDFTLERGQRLLASSRRAEDKAKKEKTLAQARTMLEQSSAGYKEAAKLYGVWLEQLAPAAEASASGVRRSGVLAERQEAEVGTVEARFKGALASYYLAQTFEEADENRAKFLKRASTQFDDLYQELRNTAGEACLFAHLWQGKTQEELGELQTALEIYEEVLASAPDGGGGESAMAPLYAQAAFFQLQAVAKQGSAEDFVREAGKWLQLHKGWRRIPAYQGLTLELAKAQMSLADKASGEAKNKLMQQAMAALRSASRVESEYKEEAILLQQQVLKALGGENVGGEEYFALGDAALASRRLDEAETNYSKALKLATENKDEKLAGQAKLRLSRVRYGQALALHNAGKFDEALKAAGEMAAGDASDPSVSHAAMLALSSAVSICANAKEAKDKDAALARLEKVVEFVVKKWAGRPEADDARITLGQARLLRGENDAAMTSFAQVTPGSPRYPAVLYLLGQMHWKAYQAERRKDDASRHAELMTPSRAKALKSLQDAVGLLGKGLRADTADSPAQLAEAQLLLGEILLEGKEYKQAIALLDPLVAKIKAVKPRSIEAPTFGTFMTAVRAHMAIGETDRAAEIGLVLVELSEDKAKFNEVLVTFARLLAQEFSRADAALAQVPLGNAKALEEASVKRNAVRQLLAKVLEPLLKRRQYSMADLAHLGDLCAAVGLNDQALQQYQRMTEKAQQDPDSAKTADRAVVRARSQLIGLLRAQGKFEEALKQSDELIAKNPRSLEPRMARAYILEDWAKKDPAKYPAAVAAWTEVRVLLGRLTQKPPEYYEVIYRTATCLFEQWQATKDQSKLLQAEQVLKSTLILNSKLTGPDLVAKYNELLKRVVAAREKIDKDRKAK